MCNDILTKYYNSISNDINYFENGLEKSRYSMWTEHWHIKYVTILGPHTVIFQVFAWFSGNCEQITIVLSDNETRVFPWIFDTQSKV